MHFAYAPRAMRAYLLALPLPSIPIVNPTIPYTPAPAVAVAVAALGRGSMEVDNLSHANPPWLGFFALSCSQWKMPPLCKPVQKEPTGASLGYDCVSSSHVGWNHKLVDLCQSRAMGFWGCR